MRLSASELDWSTLSEEGRQVLEQVIPLRAAGYGLDEIAAKLGVTRETIAKAEELLAAEVQALSGKIALPPLSDDEYETLKASIAEHGQQVPILRGSPSSGKPAWIVDGNSRLRVCRELKLIPIVQELDGSAEELERLALVVNLARRHATASARRAVIKAELVRDGSRSDRAIAVAVGVDHKTVGAVRRELEQSGDVGKFPTRTDTTGREQPVREREPDPEPQHVTLRLKVDRELVPELVDRWVECKAFRLHELREGVYELQVRRLDAAPSTSEQRERIEAGCARIDEGLKRSAGTARAELLRTASYVFGRELSTLDELAGEEAEWAVAQLDALSVGLEAVQA